jgi:hypothetical protein
MPSLTELHGPFLPDESHRASAQKWGRLAEDWEWYRWPAAWVYQTLVPRLLRMAGADALAEEMEDIQGADEAL